MNIQSNLDLTKLGITQTTNIYRNLSVESLIEETLMNGEGVLEVLVTSLAQDNTLARMIHLVEKAKDQKPPIQRFLDKFAKIYTPAVVGVAIMIAVVPPLFFDEPFLNSSSQYGWLYRALTMLVIACPCALLISTPVTIISAITSAAKQGVLIKGGAFLEILGRVRVLAFDKTGTLTLGKPRVVDFICNIQDKDFIKINNRSLKIPKILFNQVDKHIIENHKLYSL